MKKFVIHYNYYATVDVTVLANSKEEAIEKADQIEFDNNDFELDFESRCCPSKSRHGMVKK